jgi:hypothetical protein
VGGQDLAAQSGCHKKKDEDTYDAGQHQIKPTLQRTVAAVIAVEHDKHKPNKNL